MRGDGDGSRNENKMPVDEYLWALSSASVPVEKRQWYVRWVERFSAFLGETPLHAADRGAAERKGSISRDGALLLLTEKGRETARQAMVG